MSWISKALTSTLGRKLVMSITGLFLTSFLFVHLGGNIALFYHDNGEAFNAYSHFMSTAAPIRVLELVLLAGFSIHIYTAYVLTQRNKGARPIPYAHTQPSPGVTWFSRNMGTSGTIVLIFLLVHLKNFWYTYHYGEIGMVTVDGQPIKDMYSLTATVFKNDWYISILYIVAMVLLGFHLNHGFASAFRSLGWEHKKYTPALQAAGAFISIVIPAGFASMPIYFMLR